MTKARVWPNNAAAARDDALMAASDGLRALMPLIEGKPVTNEEQVRRLALAVISFHKVINRLQSVENRAGSPDGD